MTLEPLDVSAYAPTSTDSPELVAYKKKVDAAITKYGEQTGWCRSGREQARRELDLVTVTPEVVVTFETTHPLKFAVKMPVKDLLGKPVEQQTTALLIKLGVVSVGTTTGSVGNLTVTPEQITTWSVVTPAPVDGYAWRYVSDMGRVMHAFPPNFAERRSAYVDSLCGSVTGWRPEMTENSPRGVGTYCSKCQSRANRTT